MSVGIRCDPDWRFSDQPILNKAARTFFALQKEMNSRGRELDVDTAGVGFFVLELVG